MRAEQQLRSQRRRRRLLARLGRGAAVAAHREGDSGGEAGAGAIAGDAEAVGREGGAAEPRSGERRAAAEKGKGRKRVAQGGGAGVLGQRDKQEEKIVE